MLARSAKTRYHVLRYASHDSRCASVRAIYVQGAWTHLLHTKQMVSSEHGTVTASCTPLNPRWLVGCVPTAMMVAVWSTLHHNVFRLLHRMLDVVAQKADKLTITH